MATLALLVPMGAGAADSPTPRPKATPPADFLEYLASLEGKDDNWTDFVLDQEQSPPKDKPAATNAAKAQPK